LRSLIPALYEPSLDIASFPLCPVDFHSQYIMIFDAPAFLLLSIRSFIAPMEHPLFRKYPLFIVDHPLGEDDHPIRQLNVRDQDIFISEQSVHDHVLGTVVATV
jgi:hypothetical protein